MRIKGLTYSLLSILLICTIGISVLSNAFPENQSEIKTKKELSSNESDDQSADKEVVTSLECNVVLPADSDELRKDYFEFEPFTSVIAELTQLYECTSGAITTFFVKLFNKTIVTKAP